MLIYVKSSTDPLESIQKLEFATLLSIYQKHTTMPINNHYKTTKWKDLDSTEKATFQRLFIDSCLSRSYDETTENTLLRQDSNLSLNSE